MFTAAFKERTQPMFPKDSCSQTSAMFL